MNKTLLTSVMLLGLGLSTTGLWCPPKPAPRKQTRKHTGKKALRKLERHIPQQMSPADIHEPDDATTSSPRVTTLRAETDISLYNLQKMQETKRFKQKARKFFSELLSLQDEEEKLNKVGATEAPAKLASVQNDIRRIKLEIQGQEVVLWYKYHELYNTGQDILNRLWRKQEQHFLDLRTSRKAEAQATSPQEKQAVVQKRTELFKKGINIVSTLHKLKRAGVTTTEKLIEKNLAAKHAAEVAIPL